MSAKDAWEWMLRAGAKGKDAKGNSPILIRSAATRRSGHHRRAHHPPPSEENCLSLSYETNCAWLKPTPDR